MPKRKADALAQVPAVNGSKKVKPSTITQKIKPSLLHDNDPASSSDDDSVGGAKLDEPELKINEEYAKRFEHNKKREELHNLEEKYQKTTKLTNSQYGDKYDEDSSSSDDEDEDDDGFLATEALDAEISATLQAIRSKDPRVYDEKVTFYATIEEGDDEDAVQKKKEKPMYLSDYHRENLLKGHTGADDEEEAAPRTFAQEQEDLKNSIVKEMHAAAEDSSDEENDEDGGFLIPKAKPQSSSQGVHLSRAGKVKVDVDVATAEKDPETFLSNFMAARAWVPSDGVRFQPLESDDDEEDERAEKFEAAYNLRFEDPKDSNEMLKSYARDVVAAKTVRREESTSRKKRRDAYREKREAGKLERDDERARLRRLKIEEMEEKLQKIKKAAGLRGKTLNIEEWTKFLDDGWDDEQWEAEMSKRFGEDYYAEQEASSDRGDAESDSGTSKKQVKKPKWDDDIDIKDLIPESAEEEQSQRKPAFTLSDSEDDDENEDEVTPKKSKTSKNRQQERQAKKKAARLERKKIEDFVDSRMELDIPTKSKQTTSFRYRETSPTSFGLTARDILMAPDAALNQFAGLKKMAAFRDAEKKRKDKKNLGKKARLRQWRKETFGNEDGPEIVINTDVAGPEDVDGGVDIVEGGRKKKKRSRKNKSQAPVTI